MKATKRSPGRSAGGFDCERPKVLDFHSDTAYGMSKRHKFSYFEIVILIVSCLGVAHLIDRAVHDYARGSLQAFRPNTIRVEGQLRQPASVSTTITK